LELVAQIGCIPACESQGIGIDTLSGQITVEFMVFFFFLNRLIGSLYGRVVGLSLVSLFGVHIGSATYWKWMDPGAFALIGAASFMGGVTRLTMTVTVIMVSLGTVRFENCTVC
jgi:H+/Cl- antiporter ClcA